MKNAEVAREAAHAQRTQRGEPLCNCLAHEPERAVVVGKADRIGPATIERRRDARNEHGMVGKPAVHIGHSLDRKTATSKHSFQVGNAWIVSQFESCRLLRDSDKLDDPVNEDSADAREAQVNRARPVGWHHRTTSGIVSEKE